MGMRRVLLGVLLWLVVAHQAHAAQRVALVIGNGAYQSVPQLPNPPRDADAMAATLAGLGFKVTTVRNATRRELGRKVLEFGRVSNGAEVALVFYAGHGLQVDGANYLVPVDAALQDDLSLGEEAYRLDDLLNAIASAQARVVLVDACRDNPFAVAMKRSQATRSIGRGLARVSSQAGGTLIAFATDPDNVAADGAGGNSPFTSALLGVLPQPGLEIRLAMGRVRAEVARLTQNRQVPWVNESLFGELYLAGGQAAPAATPAMDPRAAEEAAFSAAQAANSVQGWQIFKRSYPGSAYGATADIQLAALLHPAPGSSAAAPSKTPVDPATRQIFGLAIRSATLLQQSPQSKDGMARMREEFDARKAALEKERAQLATDTPVLSAAELQDRRDALERKRKKFQDDITRRDQELTLQLMTDIRPTVIAVAREMGASYVVQDPTYADAELDITDEVLKRLFSGITTAARSPNPKLRKGLLTVRSHEASETVSLGQLHAAARNAGVGIVLADPVFSVTAGDITSDLLAQGPIDKKPIQDSIIAVRRDALFTGAPQYSATKKKFEAEFGERKQKLESEMAQYASDKKAGLRSAEQLEKTKTDLKKRRDALQGDVERRDRELSAAMTADLNSEIFAFARSRDIKVVIQDPVYIRPDLDATEAILEQLVN